jgi:hypothetical protein
VIVVYTPGNHVYRSTPTERSARSDAENRLPRRLFIVVAVLGLTAYGASFGPVADGGWGTGWSVRFAALAALCAAFSLLPRQNPQTLVTAALATMGFLDALSDVVLTAQAEWPLTVIAALNGVQAAAAIAALVFWRQAVAGNPETAGYDAYVDYYNQAVRQYYGQQAQAPTPQATADHGYGQASRGARAAATAEHAPRASQSGDYADFLSPQPKYDQSAAAQNSPAQPVPPPGLPGFGPGQTYAGQSEERTERTERRSWPQ